MLAGMLNGINTGCLPEEQFVESLILETPTIERQTLEIARGTHMVKKPILSGPE